MHLDALLRFWAKAKPDAQATTHSHPVIGHNLDVAACAMTLPHNLPFSEAQLGFLLALHDIGKFARCFQAKAPEAWDAALFGCEPPAVDDPGHEGVGHHLVRLPNIRTLLAPLFANLMPWERDALLHVIFGHHGKPHDLILPPAPTQLGPLECEAAETYVRHLLDLFRPEPLPAIDSDHALATLTWRLAGFVVLADWLGSSREQFTYVEAKHFPPLSDYLARSRRIADHAVATSGIRHAKVAPFAGLRHLFPQIAQPTPLQRKAETEPLPEGPVLVLVEDMTGAGKTEAALTLAHRLLARGRGDGLYFALPTMATANGMFRRLRKCWSRFFVPGTQPSLALSHGRADLIKEFTSTILPMFEDIPVIQGNDSEAQCAGWLGDERRKALLAHVGVGTIDQALLSILPVRHAALRLWGLSQKVLVIDEAHAFDSYMREEIFTLLRFHAALGGSAIILSATLPMQLRQRLVDAYSEGLGVQPETVTAEAYPLMTLASASGVREAPCLARPAIGPRTAVRRVGSFREVLSEIEGAARLGAAVCWVRNTVDEAIEAARLLRSRGLDPILFHARFAMEDRLAIEAEVLDIFGKTSTPDQRARVLIATQVVEQSLDLDFDLMITDLAPVDLVIQRAGRLWRHIERPHRPLPRAELLLYAPEPAEDAIAEWLDQHKGSAAVYADPSLLWRSTKALLDQGAIKAPGHQDKEQNLRTLIEAAAAEGGPGALVALAQKAREDESRQEAIAKSTVLRFEDGYRRSAPWTSEESARTRLEDQPTVTIRLGFLESGKFRPYSTEKRPSLAWALSEVSASLKRAAAIAAPSQMDAAMKATRETWNELDRDNERLLLGCLARRPDPQGSPVPVFGLRDVRYHPREGLLLPRSKGDG
ncbi:CRISPR-associated helicase Cas3' [Sabulicella rubraurantiaca]|uniref:CRISPR-associated helicase Cas3' n=1 Tax=Sabulicella rubraurantiaca TaxID=2811429 RepID=UPI001A973484|nr:CRISPR-associated helicase Cas3' [Sabulicella rubraurantiaca]